LYDFHGPILDRQSRLEIAMKNTQLPVHEYPHMRRENRGAAARVGICVVDADASGVILALGSDRRSQALGWHDLIEAANQDAPGKGGDSEYAAIYGDLYLQAVKCLDRKPLASQGVVVKVDTRTSGATWYTAVIDAAERYRRDLMRADEGMDMPHRGHAESERREIAERLSRRKSVKQSA
jgi:hypothetical protein